MRLANLALDELTEALNRGLGERDSRVAMLLQEERAGVEVRVDEARLRAVLDRDPPAAPSSSPSRMRPSGTPGGIGRDPPEVNSSSPP